MSTKSKVVKNRHGDHVWDETVERIEIPGVGLLEKWSTGRHGSAGEYHKAKLTASTRLSEERLAELGKEHELRSGDIIQKTPPREEKPQEQSQAWTYHWSYCPSTE